MNRQHSLQTRIRANGTWVAVLLLATALSARASCNDDPECGDVTAWSQFTRISLRQSTSDSPQTAEWVASFDHETADGSIDVVTRESKDRTKGTVALIGGRIMLTRGLTLEPGYEIDTLDGAMLSIKLVMIVLGRVFPQGPDQVKGATDVDRTDRSGIKFATPSADGYIPAPWHVKGRIIKPAAETVRFDLTLAFSPEGDESNEHPVTLKMSGELGKLQGPVFRDTDSLDGWKIYGLGPRQVTDESSTILDYGAKATEPARYKTVGDIRAYLTAEDDPGTRDTTKDFSGFWKQQCDEAFGLQVKHHGDDGKYAIVFCGPGGCGDDTESRLTFITGDKHYEVVSEDEFIVSWGDRQPYHRCTKDTNPVLKYK